MARDLLPVRCRTAAGGPTKTTPELSHASARSGFSDRKPYPDRIAWALHATATSTMARGFR